MSDWTSAPWVVWPQEIGRIRNKRINWVVAGRRPGYETGKEEGKSRCGSAGREMMQSAPHPKLETGSHSAEFRSAKLEVSAVGLVERFAPHVLFHFEARNPGTLTFIRFFVFDL